MPQLFSSLVIVALEEWEDLREGWRGVTSWDGVGWEGGWRQLSYLTKGVARSAVARNLKTFPRSLFSPDGEKERGERKRDESEGTDGKGFCSDNVSARSATTLSQSRRVLTSIQSLRFKFILLHRSISNALIAP